MTHTCPCCGAPINAEAVPVKALAHVRLGHVQGAVLRIMIAAFPEKVQSERLQNAVYGAADDAPENTSQGIKWAVSELRKSLRPYGWTVSKSERGPILGAWRLERLA